MLLCLRAGLPGPVCAQQVITYFLSLPSMEQMSLNIIGLGSEQVSWGGGHRSAMGHAIVLTLLPLVITPCPEPTWLCPLDPYVLSCNHMMHLGPWPYTSVRTVAGTGQRSHRGPRLHGLQSGCRREQGCDFPDHMIPRWEGWGDGNMRAGPWAA